MTIYCGEEMKKIKVNINIKRFDVRQLISDLELTHMTTDSSPTEPHPTAPVHSFLYTAAASARVATLHRAPRIDIAGARNMAKM
jgi:hypothetical protein